MVGQMLMVGFRGTELADDASILEDIRRRNIGGVILFDYDVELGKPDRNIKSPAQLKQLVSRLESAASTPLLIAIDQEGGTVNRLKEKYGFAPTYSAEQLGDRDDPAFTQKCAYDIASTLAEMGINVNFAPCVDVNVNPDNPAIGSRGRSFSADPEKVALHARAFAEGLGRGGVLSCIKHFPGHGSAYNDSHKGLTDITDTWTESELIPFRRMTESAAADMVMTAHLINTNVDPNYPATLSRRFITDILRGELGWGGVIVTDDMQMGAIVQEYSFSRAVRLSINAGADILLFGNNLHYEPDAAEKTIEIITEMVSSGEISAGRIEQSYQRIMRLKNSLQ
jgi:beta-N-acetylhexosaminidase